MSKRYYKEFSEYTPGELEVRVRLVRVATQRQFGRRQGSPQREDLVL